MDDDLAQRYLALFLAYNVGGRGDLEALKLRILQSTPEFLRPDAALLLLSLYDQMIFRPFTGQILSPTREWMKIPPIGRELASFNQRHKQSRCDFRGTGESSSPASILPSGIVSASEIVADD
jgi:hypothetical protein